MYTFSLWMQKKLSMCGNFEPDKKGTSLHKVQFKREEFFACCGVARKVSSVLAEVSSRTEVVWRKETGLIAHHLISLAVISLRCFPLSLSLLGNQTLAVTHSRRLIKGLHISPYA